MGCGCRVVEEVPRVEWSYFFRGEHPSELLQCFHLVRHPLVTVGRHVVSQNLRAVRLEGRGGVGVSGG